MLRPSMSRKTWRAMLSVAAASAAVCLAGCASEQPSQSSYWGDNGSPTPAMQASENTPPQQQPQEARQNQAPAENAMYFPTGSRNGSDLMVEQTGPREVRVGQQYQYQLRVTNLTNQKLTGIMLRQQIPDNFKLASDQQGREKNGQINFKIGDLNAHQSKTINLSGTPSQPGTLDTCTSAQYNPPMLCTHVAVVAPQIKVTAQGPSQADVCDDLVYRYTVANTGTGTAHDVVLHEKLPDGLATTDGRQTLSMNIGDLAQGQSKDVEAHLRASQPGQFTTRAMVKSDAGNAQAQQIATNVLAPRLQVIVTGPKEEYLGQPLSYQVTVKNIGDAPAADARVRLGATPGHVDFVSAQGAQGAQLASEREGTGQNLGTIPPGESRTVTVNFQTKEGGPLAVDATAHAQCAQDVTTSVNTNINTITASTLDVRHDPDPVAVGTDVTYHVTVVNKGTAPDHDVKVTAVVPEGEQFVKASGQTQATNDGQNITFGPIATLQPKQSVSWEVVAKAVKPQQVQFKATMTSQSTPQAAVKLEPTKLFGSQGGTQTHTNQADQPAPAAQQQPAQNSQTPELNK